MTIGRRGMIETHKRLAYAAWTAGIVCAGLLCRWPALGLPWFVAKYAGSALWAAMVYTGLRAVNPRAAASVSMTAAITVAICVELSRLYNQPELDAFRLTLAGYCWAESSRFGMSSPTPSGFYAPRSPTHGRRGRIREPASLVAAAHSFARNTCPVPAGSPSAAPPSSHSRFPFPPNPAGRKCCRRRRPGRRRTYEGPGRRDRC